MRRMLMLVEVAAGHSGGLLGERKEKRGTSSTLRVEYDRGDKRLDETQPPRQQVGRDDARVQAVDADVGRRQTPCQCESGQDVGELRSRIGAPGVIGSARVADALEVHATTKVRVGCNVDDARSPAESVAQQCREQKRPEMVGGEGELEAVFR